MNDLDLHNESQRKLGEELRSYFIVELARCGNVSKAAAFIGTSRQRIYEWRRQHPKFKEDWDHTMETWIDRIESIGIQQAIDGNTSMIQFLLRSWRRDRYDAEMQLRLALPRELAHRFYDFSGSLIHQADDADVVELPSPGAATDGPNELLPST